jgi:hypothetical protein
VFAGGEEVARIRRRFSPSTPAIHIECFLPEAKKYTIHQGAIHHDKQIVGRIYYLRNFLYLDIEESEFHPAILGLFVAMT